MKNIISAAVLLFILTGASHAACVNPPGEKGYQIYNSTHDVMQYCNGSKWIGMGGGGGGFDLTCASGQVAGYDGTDWVCAPSAIFSGTVQAAAPTANNHLTTKAYVDAAVASAAGGGGTTCMYFTVTDNATCPAGWAQAGANTSYKPDGTTAHRVCCMGGGSLLDEMPTAFDFPASPALDPDKAHTWSPVQITGFDSASVSIQTTANSGTGEFRICSDAACSNVLKGWGTSPTGIAAGNYLQIRIGAFGTAPRPYDAAITITVGGMIDVAQITPEACHTGAIGVVCTDGAFYIGTAGGNRIYARASDSSSSVQWKTGNTDTSGTDDAIDGKANTDAMIAAGASAHPAAQSCRGHGANWYVPAQQELALIWTNRTAIGLSSKGINTGGTYYWSSTQHSTSYAWVQRFSDGNQDNNGKTNNYRVRCVRR